MIDEQFMVCALEQAKIAQKLGEVPVGCVVVKDDKVISVGHNFRETKNTPLGHAEIMAIHNASKVIGDWRLNDCTIYITLEPCPMCMGAIINSRIGRVVFGAFDDKGGCCGSLIQLADCGFSHRPPIKSKVLELECSIILKEFFNNKRAKTKSNKI